MLGGSFRDSGTAMIYDCTHEMSTAPLCKRRKSGSERMHISGSKDIYRVSQQRSEELHPPDGMGSRHGDEVREKEQHARQAVTDDPHDDVIVAVALDRAEHRDRLACSLT